MTLWKFQYLQGLVWKTTQLWLRGTSCFPIQVIKTFSGCFNPYFEDMRLNVYRLPNFYMPFEFLIKSFFQEELFLCLQKVDHVANYWKSPIVINQEVMSRRYVFSFTTMLFFLLITSVFQIQETMILACENIRFSSLFVAGDVSRGGTSATQQQKFHTDDTNPCLHNKSGSHGVPNINLSHFTCLLVDFGKVFCLSVNELQQNSLMLLLEKTIFHKYWLFC